MKGQAVKTEEQEKDFAYADLLMDNAPVITDQYSNEASILNKEIANPNVFNIAVVAKYGAGKSSAINTYLAQYRNKRNHKEKKQELPLGNPARNKYARISLASFNGGDNNASGYDEPAMERSILQQLLFSAQKNKLPNSRIERTNKSSWWKSIGFALLCAIFVFSVTLMGIEFSLYSREYKAGAPTSLFSVTWLKFVFLAVAAISLLIVLSIAFHYHKLKKVKYKDFEAEINDKGEVKENASLINKFVNEVLYFFECIDIDLVIFEDLDRLATIEIFTKLRELNTIINSSNKKATKVTFLYAVKDDLFATEEERAKFFEFILPIIPTINPVNTQAELENMLKKLSDKNPRMKLDGKFIRGISAYIQDMRILKNTFNDYVIMFHKIFDDENASSVLDSNKLFALCLYKNLFPYDYTLLERNAGLIPKIVDINALRQKCLQKVNDELKSLEEKRKQLQDARIKSFEELKGIFILQISKLGSVGYSASIDPWKLTTFQNVNFSTIMHPTNPNRWIIAVPQDGIKTPYGEDFVELEKRIIEREQNGVELVKKDIEELEKQRQIRSHWPLSNVVENLGLETCFSDDVKTSYVKVMSSKNVSNTQIELQIRYLRFLVAQNYIDEHYIEYTSNYQANNLSPNDIRFLQDLQGGQINFDAQIDNVISVFRWLDERDFSQSAVLTKILFDNIETLKSFSNDEKSSKYDNLILLLSDTKNPIVLDVISEYLNIADDNKCDILLRNIIPHRPVLCSEILKIDKLGEKKKDFILAATIKYSTNYLLCDNDKTVANYLEMHNDYAHVFSMVQDVEKSKKFIQELSVIFKQLYTKNLDAELQQFIISNNHYALTLDNLATIYTISGDKGEEFYNKNYGFILQSENDAVIRRIQDNLNDYLRLVLLDNRISCKAESYELMRELLLNEGIEIESRIKLTSKIVAKYENIADFNIELFKALLDNGVVIDTWRNVEYAFEKKGFDCVKDYLEKTDKIEGKFCELEGIGAQIPTQLINAILVNMEEKTVRKLAVTLPAATMLSGLGLSEIADENLAAFIDAGKILYNNADLKAIYTLPKSLCAYGQKFEREILNNFSEFFVEAFPQENTVYQQISTNGRVVRQPIVELVAKPNAQNIIAAIIGCNRIKVEIKKELIDKCCEIINIKGNERAYVKYIINEGQAVPAKILWQFIEAVDAITPEERITILANCINNVDTIKDLDNYKKYIQTLGGGWKDLFNAKPVKIEQTESNETLLKLLQCRKLVKYKKSHSKKENSFIVEVI